MNNYTTHAIAYMNTPQNIMATKLAYPKSWRKIATSLTMLDEADKYIMPDYGRVFKEGSRPEDFADLLRLPAPLVALEYFCPRKLHKLPDDMREHPYFPKRRIALCIDLNQVPLSAGHPENSILVFSVFEVQDDVWTFAPSAALINPKTIQLTSAGRLSVDTVPFLAEMYDRGYSELEAATDLADEVVAAVEFMMTVNCENVKRERIEAPAKLNKKRAKNGKPPFYSYWLLDVFKEGRAHGPHQGGSHNSPRFHFRRGHIRRYRDEQGNIRFTRFIKRMAVGNATLGHVDKTYRINSMESAK